MILQVVAFLAGAVCMCSILILWSLSEVRHEDAWQGNGIGFEGDDEADDLELRG